MQSIEGCRLFVFDLDGVIYRGDKLLPYAKECIEYLLTNNYKVFFLTNNSTKTRKEYCRKLNLFEIPASEDMIMTSAYATGLYFRENKISGVNVLVIGEDGLIRELENVGLNIVRLESLNFDTEIGIDYVVAGLDFNFNYTKLALCQKAILEGAKFIATNADATFPAEHRILPGGGAIVCAIEKATGIKPYVIGKPETYTLEKILQIADVPPHFTVVIGDRLETDILVGKKLGTKTVLVLTGVTQRKDLNELTYNIPDYVIDNLGELLEIISYRP